MKIKRTSLLTFFIALIFQFSFSQELSIKGNITDSTGIPVSGVTIIIDGTNIGVVSDFDGNYSISANPGLDF